MHWKPPSPDQITTFAIVSGDSDFGPLVQKLREYGRYTLGIGPRSVTHPLLIKACDEFVYLESIFAEGIGDHDLTSPVTTDNETARALMEKALRVHAQRGELPVLAAKLKQTMLLMDPAFNEANFGFSQFKNWLEDNNDLLQLYCVKLSFLLRPRILMLPASGDCATNAPSKIPLDSIRTCNSAATSLLEQVDEPILLRPPLRTQYMQIFNRLKMTSVDFATRRDVLRDIYRELIDRPGSRTTDELLEQLCERYETQGLIRSKTTLRQIWQMGFRQRVFDYGEQVASVHAPVWLAPEIESEADFVRRAESGFVYAVLNAGLEVDKAEMASILLNDHDQIEYIQSLLDDLEKRELIVNVNDRYMLARQCHVPFRNDPALEPVWVDVDNVELPDNLPATPEKARTLAKTAMLQRSQDFAASARSYLYACRVQWEAIEAGEPGSTLEDLRWYMASYASVRAGELSQIHRDYAQSRPYYLAFFYLVQEDDPLWGRMRGLINPMLSYYWVNAWRELGLNAGNPNLNATTPAEIALRAATHENQELCRLWFNMTNNLGEVNPGLLKRVANQIRLNRSESPVYQQIADQLEQMLME
jgi:hypothetical protein